MSDYKKQTWVDDETPVDAEHLNHMEDGIADAYSALSSYATKTEVSDVQDIADSAYAVAIETKNSALTGVTVNGKSAKVTDHVASIEIDYDESSETLIVGG